MKIDITKKYKTRDGQDFTPLSDKGRGDYPIIGYIGKANVIQRWSKDGLFCLAIGCHDYDLVEVKEKKVAYVNIYPNGVRLEGYPSRSKADGYAGKDRIACVRVEYEEGQFDE